MDTISDKKSWNPFVVAWILGLLFYFLEYAVRSAPSIMLPDLIKAFATTPGTVSAVIGTYYLTYSVTSLAAGIAIDKAGAKYPLFTGAIILGLGCVLFSVANLYTGYAGRLLQGMGSALAFPACVYLAARAFSPKKLATAIGATQSLGMLGGSAGQFLSAPALKSGLPLSTFWIGMGIASFVIAGLIFYFTPAPQEEAVISIAPKRNLLAPYKIVFSNPQSYLSGLVSGLLFAPTTIFAMTWGVAFFQTGRGLDYTTATLACALVPLGWAVGCPLMGWLADRYGRKPIVIAGAVVKILSLAQLCFLPTLIPPYFSTFLMGIASGAAMIPYSVIKEANPDSVKGSATGAINFLTFGVTSLLGPLFSYLYGNSLNTVTNVENHFKGAVTFFIIVITVAIVACLFLKETGKNAQK
jgi:MFS family permease